MKHSTKKIFAREFLIFVSCITVVGICYLGILSYNAIIFQRMKLINQEVRKYPDVYQLRDSYREKLTNRNRFFSALSKYDTFTNDFNSYEKAWDEFTSYFQKDGTDLNKYKVAM